MKKKGLSIWVLVLIIVLILGVGATGGYLYFGTDLFKKPEYLFWNYLSQETELFKIFENEYKIQQTEVWKNNSYVSSGSLTTLSQKGEKTNNINMTTATRYDKATGRTYAEANLKNEQKDILTFSYINSGDVYAIKCNDILKYYIGIRNAEINELISKLSDNQISKNALPEKIEIKPEEIITQEEQQQILNTYYNIVKQNILEENYSKSTNSIDINGTSYNANAYTLKLDKVNQILSSCLESAKTDTTILNIIERSKFLTREDFISLLNFLENDFNSYNMQMQLTIYEKDGKTIRVETVINVENELETTMQYKLIINNVSNGEELAAEILLGVGEKGKELQTSKVKISKIKEENAITNKYEILPDVSKQNEMYLIESKIGKLINDSATNTFITTIKDEFSTTKATYNKNINKVEQVENIMELKNDNAIIINNYSKKQINQLIEKNILGKASKVINKINKVVAEDNPINIYVTSIMSLARSLN